MLLFMDGMAHYTTAQLPVKYSTVSTANGAIFSVVAEGRTGNCIKRTTAGNGSPAGYLAIAPLMSRTGIWPQTTSGVCGFALKVNTLVGVYDSPPGGETDLFVVMEGNAKHVSIALTQDGTFLLRGREKTGIGQEVLLAQSAEGIQSNSWAYLEFQWVIHETAGRFILRMNGMPLIDFTGNTLQQYVLPSPMFLGTWTAVRLLGTPAEPGYTLTYWMCDLYLADLTAPLPDDVHDFLGDGVIVTIMPNGVGAASDWEPIPGVPNWDQVNDRPGPDDDATYVRATDAGQRDVYQFENIPSGSTVLGAHYNILAKKEGDGMVMLQPIANQGGTDYLSPAQGIGDLTYARYYTVPYDVNPATGLQWTAGEINAGQWGVRKQT